MNREIYEKLRALREQSGMTREELAERLRVSPETVAGWENADILPDTESMIAIAGLYGISLDRLFGLNNAAEQRRSSAPAEKMSYAEPDNLNSYFKYETADESGLPAPVQGSNPDTGNLPVTESMINEFTNIIDRIRNDKKFYKRLMKFPYPLFATGAFLFSGSVFNLWHPAWMLFLTIPLYYTAIPAIHKKNPNIFCYPVLVTLLYLIAGFALNLWHPGWLAFLTVPVYYWAVNFLKDEKNKGNDKLPDMNDEEEHRRRQ